VFDGGDAPKTAGNEISGVGRVKAVAFRQGVFRHELRQLDDCVLCGTQSRPKNWQGGVTIEGQEAVSFKGGNWLDKVKEKNESTMSQVRGRTRR